MNKPVLLACERVKKDFGTPEGPLSVLKGVDFSLSQGQIAFIVGRSGSGKSTLMHLFGGLDRASEGRIFFKGNDLGSMNEKELAIYRNRKIGFVFQFFHLLPELTLFENVLLPSLMSGNAHPERARELIQRVGLSGREKHFPNELSGGEQQRTAIARALVNRPELVLCDEPTGNLDDETARTVFDLLTGLHRTEGLTLLIVTHNEGVAHHFENVYRLQEGILIPDTGRNIHGSSSLY